MKKSVIAIIGAGYSGTTLATLLHQRATSAIDILLFEKRDAFAKGAAYSTQQMSHLLNVPAGKMSAYADKPSHLLEWLQQRTDLARFHLSKTTLASDFIPRQLYADYLQSLLHAHQSTSHYGATINCQQATVVDINECGEYRALTLDDGQTIRADQIILAIGNETPEAFPLTPDDPHVINNPWDYRALQSIERQARVFIIGTGLTMVDTVLSLLDNAHQGPITALSRRGLLPRAHATINKPFTLQIEELPSTPRQLWRWFRETSTRFSETGGDWRAVIDAIRPHTQTLWRQFSLQQQQQFLRHCRSTWDVLRHRIAPTVATRINTAPHLNTLAGRINSIEKHAGALDIHYRPRGKRQQNTITADYVINCTGPSSDYNKLNNPLIQSLIKKQYLTADAIKLGIAIDDNGKLIGQAQALYSLGPPTKGSLWEIVAVPDIRVQCSRLCDTLLAALT